MTQAQLIDHMVTLYDPQGSGYKHIEVSNKTIVEDIDFEKLHEALDKTYKRWNNLADFYQNNDVSVRVFNQEYIRNTINKNDCDSIVFGDKNKEVQDEIQRLETENEKIREQLGSIEQKKLEDKEPKYPYQEKSQYFVNTIIADRNLIDNNKFSFSHLKNMLEDPKIQNIQKISDDEYNKNIELIKSTNIKEIPKITFSNQIQEIYKQTQDLLKTTIEVVTTTRIINDKTLNDWVRDGYNSFYKNTKELPNCPFCDQHINTSIWNTLNSMFSDSELTLVNSIKQLQQINNEFKDQLNFELATECTGISKEKFQEIKNDIQEKLNQYRKILSSIDTLLNNKLSKLNEDLNIEEFEIPNLECMIESYNNIISTYNDTLKDLKTNKTSAVEELKRHYIAKLVPEYQDYKQKLATYKAEIEKLDNDISNLNIKINTNSDAIQLYKNKLKNVDISISNINTALNDYLGHNSIKFINVEKNDGSKFKLVRLNEQEEIVHSDEPIHLSEGETTLVAFIYFIQQLNHKNENKSIDNKENYIIVIDDPITSMDVDFIYYIINMIRGLLDDEKDNKLSYQFKQVIFMTHHFMLFRELWKILHDSRDNKYKLFFSNYLLERKSKYLSIDKLPEFYKKHDTEYLYIFQSLHNLDQELDDYQLKYYAPNLSRKLLDVFTAFKYAHNTDKFKEEFKSKCESQLGFDYTTLKRYTDSGSHLERYDMVNFQIIKEMPKKILQCIEILDKEHYDCMIEKIK